ncbi:helix-turn-helix domain-containing protein [Noviherbaspirillum pedocola]|uniref:Helix-turn-helix domain-containing protein n=1 Tax=Noviherbaspirillum pedocola TaxID=2801341 RepID=A0A934W9P0_9BURK|nr:helix-turn-helix domain-containing protein [Noviherbaspirillum pedocola]MBK4739210.1 helix-turn-helix domain-containing protein [Noviherbaspirillum pedocola]
MQVAANTDLARSAARKMATGAMMTLSETAAYYGISEQTVHALPLPSIRLGRLLRFDPKDVRELIDACKEAAICPHKQTCAGIGLTPSGVLSCADRVAQANEGGKA